MTITFRVLAAVFGSLAGFAGLVLVLYAVTLTITATWCAADWTVRGKSFHACIQN